MFSLNCFLLITYFSRNTNYFFLIYNNIEIIENNISCHLMFLHILLNLYHILFIIIKFFIFLNFN